MCYIVGLPSLPMESVEIIKRLRPAAQSVELKKWDDCRHYPSDLRRMYGSLIHRLPEGNSTTLPQPARPARQIQRILLVILLGNDLTFTGEWEPTAFFLAANRSFRRREAQPLLDLLTRITAGRMQTGAIDDLGFVSEECDPDSQLMWA